MQTGKTATFRPTAKQMETVANFLPRLQAIALQNFACVARTPDGTMVLGCVEYHPTVREFVRVCYENGLVQSFDWPGWSPTARQYMRDSKLVASARLSTCTKLITAHIRCERFCDCHLEVVLKSGHLQAILRRLKQLSRGMQSRQA